MRLTNGSLALLPALLASGAGSPPEPAAEAATEGGQETARPAPPAVPAGLEAALARLSLPGVKIDLKQWCVDVEGSICLREGLLEPVACTKGTKVTLRLRPPAAPPNSIPAKPAADTKPGAVAAGD